MANNIMAYEIDLRKFQYPVGDAEESHKSGLPKFVAYLKDKDQQPRIPGVNADQRRVIRSKYRIKVLNEHRLYDDSEMEPEEFVLLERYCTRYNRRLLQLLGM